MSSSVSKCLTHCLTQIKDLRSLVAQTKEERREGRGREERGRDWRDGRREGMPSLSGSWIRAEVAPCKDEAIV